MLPGTIAVRSISFGHIIWLTDCINATCQHGHWEVVQTLIFLKPIGLYEVINRTSDGDIAALHMAALNGHAKSVHLLLELGPSVSEVTMEDGTTIDLIGSGSTPLHYFASGGNAQCCQFNCLLNLCIICLFRFLIAKGANLNPQNANGWTPLMVACSWNRKWLEDILKEPPSKNLEVLPSPYLSLPLMSIVKIARECGWKTNE
ncbi:hypothetical protein HN873_051971 [Arachis hypogaea]